MNNSVAIVCLTRGYPFHRIYRYSSLILRNYCIKRVCSFEFTLLIFHEGNIQRYMQILIQFLFGYPIQFVDVSSAFKKRSSHIWTGKSDFPLSYSLMCQFQYFHIWQYLREFDYVVRIDEDCLLLSFNPNFTEFVFWTGYSTPETHLNTLSTLPVFLNQLGIDFDTEAPLPYTNFFVTKTEFWNRKPVSSFLYEIFSYESSLEYRWGDPPILGVALREFSTDLKYDFNSPDVSYLHLSHKSLVENGQSRNINIRILPVIGLILIFLKFRSGRLVKLL